MKPTRIPTFGEQDTKRLAGGASRQAGPFRPTTARTYKSQIDTHMAVIARLPLDSVGNKEVRELVKDMVGKGYAPTTISLTINIIKEIRASAVDSEWNELFPYEWKSVAIDAPVV